jgi:hypothetical protein
MNFARRIIICKLLYIIKHVRCQHPDSGGD